MFQRLFFLIMIVTLTACNTTKNTLPKSEFDSLIAEVQQSNKSISALFTEYQSKLDSFDSETLAFYSPMYTTVASERYKSAESLHSSSTQDNKATVKHDLMLALKSLDYAVKNKMSVKLNLKKSDTHFSELKKLNTHEHMSERFQEIETQFSKLIALIELGKVQQAINLEEDLIEKMLVLEVDSLKHIHLSDAYAFVEKSLNLQADEYAPKSLQQTKLAIQETENFINVSYRDRNGIRTKAKKAKHLAETLFHIAQETHHIHTASKQEIEDKVINDYAFINDIRKTMGSSDTSITEYALQKERTISLLVSKQAEQTRNPQLAECEKQKEDLVAEIKQLEQDVLYQNRSKISEETNKPILPELFNNVE